MSPDSTVPQSMRAFVVQEGGVAAIREVPVPTLGDNQILVRTKASALNPTDWKHIKFRSPPGVLTGCDFAGHVVQIGENLNPQVRLQVGDLVVGLVHGSTYTDRGAFAEYVKADADLVWKVPQETLSSEEAVTIGVGALTAVQAFFHPDRLGLVEPPEQVLDETWIFIYGGSTSVGQYAIQFAHLAGYKVVTVASPRSHDLVKSLGADAVFDYRDPEVISKIKQAAGDSIHFALDAYSDGGSQIISASIIAPEGGKVIVVLPASEEAQKLRSNVSITPTWLYSIFGTPWFLYGVTHLASPGDKLQMSNFMIDKLPTLVKEKNIRPMKVRLYERGLDDLNDGIDYMAHGKVDAEKLVFRISQ